VLAKLNIAERFIDIYPTKKEERELLNSITGAEVRKLIDTMTVKENETLTVFKGLRLFLKLEQ